MNPTGESGCVTVAGLGPAGAPGLCRCGCGNPAPIAKWTDNRWGHVKGQPVQFLKGHHRRVGVKKQNDPVPLPFLGGPEYAEWVAGFWPALGGEGHRAFAALGRLGIVSTHGPTLGIGATTAGHILAGRTWAWLREEAS